MWQTGYQLNLARGLRMQSALTLLKREIHVYPRLGWYLLSFAVTTNGSDAGLWISPLDTS